jgi:hypothetical protein
MSFDEKRKLVLDLKRIFKEECFFLYLICNNSHNNDNITTFHRIPVIVMNIHTLLYVF